MYGKAGIGPQTSDSPSRKRVRQCIHSVTLNFQLSSACALGSSGVESSQMDTDCMQFHQNIQSLHKGTQTIVEDGRSTSKLESELHQVKEQLRNAENSAVYLSDRVAMYRYRWLEEYYHAENLVRYMPPGTYVPDLPQIADGVPSPSTSFNFLKWDEADEGSEQVAREDISSEGVEKD
ncbi:uncharacterized protein F5891DRAFT_1198372 [Suillus fuscotomentosus]|uniref:Uncharacterized protein n=1 Tax=Suillus fuscotomentosus TaxID=1912939 RepID=A0AAD4DS11_9AGAM|nr:uncharacterized protein F5891DRAFT_1198372 [Suillus fuscotomentosus]KAG1889784.1 hypothetical protein F5891DRAFT_1198372 [Suillus fuscotomentosus]